MPESTSSRSPSEVFSCSSTSDQWNQEQAAIKHEMCTEWREPPGPAFVEENNINLEYIPNNFNHTNATNMNYNIQHCINMPYPRNTINVPNYNTVNAPPQNMPIMVHRPNNGAMANAWANQSNGRMVQTAWKKANGVKKQKRIRTAFTSNQMMELEQEYAKTKYLDRTRRIELADSLRLNERTIKIWFQNRRMKEKKDRAESLEEVNEVNSTECLETEAPAHVVEQFQPHEVFNRQGVFIEHYPVSSTSMQAPQVVAPTFPYTAPDSYQQVNFQVQYPSPYSEVQGLSPDSTAQSDTSYSQNEGDKTWDLSWIRSIQVEQEYQ